MSSSSSQSVYVEDLAARQTVEYYSKFRVVTIPDFPAFSEVERRALYEKFEAEQITPTLNLNELNSKLLDLSRQSPLTPPPDHEANIARARGLEEQARNDLLKAGCTPCYPIDLGFPLQNVSDEYEALAYYQSLHGTGLVPLKAQLSDWKYFCKYQSQVRLHYLRRKTFGAFEEKVRDRRRRHGLEGDASLDPDPEKQSRLQNWIEFQNYHLELYENLERDTTHDRKVLEAARKKTETVASEDTDVGVETFQWRVEVDESKMRQYGKLLRWIEQQRIVRAAEQATPIHATRSRDRPRGMPTLTSPGRRKGNQKSRSALDPVRAAVSKKSSTKRRSVRPSKQDVPRSQSAGYATVDLNSNAPEPRRSKRIPELRVKASPHGKESTPLRPFCPRKVTKSAKNTPKGKVSAAINAKQQSTVRSDRQKATQRSTSEVEKTSSERQTKRSGRLSFDSVRETCE